MRDFIHHRAPLVVVAIGLMLGIFANDHVALPFWVPVVTFAVGAALVITQMPFAVRLRLELRTFRRQYSMTSRTAGTALLAAAIGMVRHDFQFNHFARDHIVYAVGPDESVLVRLTARILTPPRIDAAEDRSRRSPYPVEPRTRFDAVAESLWTDTGPRAASGRVRVVVAAPALHVAAGQRVEILGRLHRFRGPDNPGQFDFAKKCRRDGLLVGLACENERNVRVLERGDTGIVQRLRTSLHRLIIPESGASDDGALLDSMVLGQHGTVEQALDDAFVRTGTIHFLCASGLNVAWLAIIVWGTMFLLGFHYRTTAAVSAVAIIAYGILADPNPPIFRASVTGTLCCFALWLRRPVRLGNWLAAAALVVLMINPSDLFDPGFQFSFVIVAALVFLAPTAQELFTRFNTVEIGGVRIPREQVRPWGSPPGIWLTISLLGSFLAWSMGVPIAAWHFERFNTWGCICSLIMSPLVFLVMVLGFARLVCASLWPTLATQLDFLLGLGTSALAHLAGGLAKLPKCSVDVPRPCALWVAAFYVVVSTLFVARRRFVRRLAWAATVPLAITFFLPLSAIFRRCDALQVWTLAVGNGSAHIIELPDGRVIAYDLGSRSLFDPAGSVIVPFLHWRGICRLDAVVISHPDFDHYGAVVDVARAIPVSRIYVNPHFERFARSDSGPRRFLDAIAAMNIPIDRLRSGDRVVDAPDLKIDVLWPAVDPVYSALSDNDTSTVVRVTYCGHSILLTGDIADAAETALIARGESSRIHSDVLVLPHHGSVAARTLPSFIRMVDPSKVVRSSGQRDRDTGQALWSAIGQRQCYSTAESGAIRVSIASGGIQIEPFR